MKHALIIGGTGMLHKVSLWLNSKGAHIAVIARDLNRLQQLKGSLKNPQAYTPLSLDYRDDDLLAATISDIQDMHRSIDCVVAWISTEAPDALRIIINEITKKHHRTGTTWKLFHVLGSRSNLEEVKKRVSPPSNCVYRQVKLGFVLENGASRWLSNDEISNGIIRGIQADREISIVGTLEPWEMRP